MKSFQRTLSFRINIISSEDISSAMAGRQEIRFSKYDALGNDFVVIDNRNGLLTLDCDLILRMCDRKRGIGANGLLEVRDHPELAYIIVYYNSDGKEGRLCGNGSRCSVAFAKQIGIVLVDDVITFGACDGEHQGGYNKGDNQYFISMKDVRVSDITVYDKDNYFLDTGTIHHVRYVRDLATYNVYDEGRQLRFNYYKDVGGSNVNFVEVTKDDKIRARTYERGVEEETLACGTGATAVALVTWLKKNPRVVRANTSGSVTEEEFTVYMEGGNLVVSFLFNGEAFTRVYLKGPVTHVFDGVYFV
ncbi:diaminopimelate epimerase-like [Gigantopelta aegis]|uniref:diaminopimelate epimerase-like n=1 Tax=Gigantopelta aegis TaxID=1735272 RepID=UPI001B8897AB|nr:diaminopimelate epimerase-like [Gigantopelta aegis]